MDDQQKEQPSLNPEAKDVPDYKQVPNLFIDEQYVGDCDEVLSQAKDRLDSYAAGRVIWDPFYYEALAYLSGRQYMEWNIKTSSLEYVRPTTNNSLRVTINKIIGKARAVVSHMTANLPTANVLPNSASNEDIYAARCGERWLSHSEFNRNMREVYREAARTTMCFGHGWIWTKWDEFGGKAFEPIYEEEDIQKPCPDCTGDNPKYPVDQCGTCGATGKVPDIDSETGYPKTQTKMDAQGNPVVKQDAYFEGEVEKKVLTPLQVYYPPETTVWEKCPDVVIGEFLNIDEIKATIPNCEDITWQDGESQTDNPWQQMVNFVVDKQSGSGQHGLMVYTYLAKASVDFPEGLELVWIKDKVRVARPMPVIKGDRLPLSHSKYIALPGLLRGMGLVEVLKATQTAYNKTMSQLLENNQRMNNVHWLVNKNTTKLVRTITNESGQVIEYEGSNPPVMSQSTAGSIVGVATAVEKILDATFDYLSGVPKTMEGFSDPSINSGVQDEAVSENAKAIHVPEIDDFVEQVSDSCSLELRYVQECLDTETLISFIGPDGRYVVDKFMGSMIADNWNVKMMPGSALTESKASQVKNIEMLLQVVMNGQADPEHKKVIMERGIELITHGERDKFVTETMSHIMKVRRVIDDIKKGNVKSEMVPIGGPPDPTTGQPAQVPAPKVFMPWHMPFASEWLEEMEMVLDSSDFDEKWDPQAKQTLAELWTYVSLKKSQMMQQQAAQMAGQSMGGGQPQKPSPGKPGLQPSKPMMPQRQPSVVQQRMDSIKTPQEGAPV